MDFNTKKDRVFTPSTLPHLVLKKCGKGVEVWKRKPQKLPPHHLHMYMQGVVVSVDQV